jgi:DNA-binding CsgD family transcriptional regulator
VFVGRGHETDRIEELLARIRAGRSGVLLIEGDAGAGKTTLLDLTEGRAAQMTVLRAVGVAGAEDLAFSGLFSILRPFVDMVEELPEPQAEALRVVLGVQGGTGGDPFLIGVALLGILAAAGERRPVVVLADDLQWMDEPSVRALLFALRRLDADRVGAVLAVRSGVALPATTEAWLRDIDVLELPPLDVDDSIALLAADNISAAVAADLHRLTGGNPLALTETAATLTIWQRRGLAAPPDAAVLPKSMSHLYGRQLDALPATTRRALVVAAVGTSDDLRLLTLALRSQHLAPADLSAAEDVGLLRLLTDTVPTSYAWKHPLVRAAVLDAAEPSLHRVAHAAQADALTVALDMSTQAGNTDRSRAAQYRAARAWHHSAATIEPDDQVADELAAVAVEASDRRAYSAAAAAYQRSAMLTVDPVLRSERLTLAAESAWRAGVGTMTDRLVDTALEHASNAQLARLYRLKGLYKFEWGSIAAAAGPMASAFRQALHTDTLTAVEIAADLVWVATFDGSPEADATACECAALADSHVDRSDPRQAALATWALCVANGIAAQPQYASTPFRETTALRAVTTADLIRARDELERLSMQDPGRWAVYAFGMDEAISGRQHACAWIDPIMATLRAHGEMSALARLLRSRGLMATWLGDWDGGWKLATEAYDLACVTGRANNRSSALHLLGEIAALRGQEETCLQFVAERRSVVEVARGIEQARLGRPIVLLALGLGRYEEAVTLLEEFYEIFVSCGRRLDGAFEYLPELVEALLLAGRAADATSRAQEFVELVDYMNAHRSQAVPDKGGDLMIEAAVQRVRGLVAESPTNASAAFDAALRAHIDNPADNPFQLARTRLVYGERLRRDGQRRAAREQLRAAAETFDRLEALPWARRANRELAATGAARRPARNVASSELTGQELRIALLAAEGLSNKEVAAQMYLSTKTIEYHLGHIYQKLGLRSRAQLARRFSSPETVRDAAAPVASA